MINKYKIESTEETFLRIWQKINFGKEVLKPEFFEDKSVKNSDDSYRLEVYQYDPNTRLFYFDNNIYWVTSDEPIYNYLDTGRAFTIKKDRYDRDSKETFYFYNDIILSDKKIINFEEYRDKDKLELKVLSETDNAISYLVFNEDLDKVKARLGELKAEEEKINTENKQEKIQAEQEEERLIGLLRQYDKMTLLEDSEAIIQDKYFIDKKAGFKVEFKDRIVNIFTKEDLIAQYNKHHKTFIEISYRDFLYKLSKIYKLGLYEDSLELKLKNINKNWLNFKIYNYNPETKVETFIKEVKIENNVNDKGKLRFKINGVKIPKQKIERVLEFIGAVGYYGMDKASIVERLSNFEDYLEKIRLYSGTQLELLNGKTLDIHLNNVRIPIHFSITAKDKEHWLIGLDDFKVEKSYKDIKDTFRYLSGGGLTAITHICDTLKAGDKLEDILIDKVKGFVEKRRTAEQKAEKLFAEFLEKNKTRVFKKDNGYIIKGKLKNYLVKMKDEERVGVWSYPANEYICINEKTKDGEYLCKFDKLLQFCLVMLNDGNLREEIHTIR